MTRHGYIDDWDYDELVRLKNYRGQVTSSIRGKRGQEFLQELLESMAALPVQELIDGEFVGTMYVSCSHWGMHETLAACALGAVVARRGVDISGIEVDDYKAIARALNIAEPLAREIMYVNDDDLFATNVDPSERFRRVRRWVETALYKGVAP